jgi:Ni/Fe-hydrogenase 1 B-type cytochrome subunit
MEKLVTAYVWEWPVRIAHWVIFISIVVLSVTGLYIGSPVTLAQSSTQYVMGWVRFIHLVTGYIFAVAVASRIYWMFAGNKYASWRAFVPSFFADGRRNMKETFLFYTFLKREAPHVTGHNALAGSAYLLVFILYIIMIFTGFALYSQYAPQSLIHNLFGWMFDLFSNQSIRLAHHFIMWLLIGFAIHHVYSAWLMDVKEKSGVISSIFGGYKSVPEKE